MRNYIYILFLLIGISQSCRFSNEKLKPERNPVFKDYHSALDSIVVSSNGVIRNITLDADIDSVKKNESLFHTELHESADTALYYEFIEMDSIYNLSIYYHFEEKKVLETEIKVNHKDYNQSQLIFFNLIQFYTKKLGEPFKDKGFYTFSKLSKEERHVLAISDDSDNLHNTISIHLYKEL